MASTAAEIQESNGLEATRVAFAKGWLKSNAVVEDVFSDVGLFVNPAWNIMLDLYVAFHYETPVCITSACVASGGAQTTAMRYIAALIDAGFIARTSNATDRRKSYVHLTARGRDRVAKAIDKAVESHRKLGLGTVRLVNHIKRTL